MVGTTVLTVLHLIDDAELQTLVSIEDVMTSLRSASWLEIRVRDGRGSSSEYRHAAVNSSAVVFVDEIRV